MKRQVNSSLARHAACGLALLLCAAGASAQMYKWTDAKGVVHFTDRPPPNKAKVELKSFTGGGPRVQLPYTLAEAIRNNPVVLYTTSPCTSCDQGRALLQKRGIPYAEKTVFSAEDKQKLAEAGSEGQVPLLLVGRNKQVGFQAGAWNNALTDAAYPAQKVLPANYQNPAAESAAPAPPPAHDLARNVVPEPQRDAPPRPPTPAPDTPPGFKF